MKIFMRILWILGLVAWVICFAFGFNYGTSNSFLVSILVFLAVLGVMVTDLIILNRVVDPESVGHHGRAASKEIAALIVYFIMVGLTVTGVARFVTIQTVVKSEVKPLAEQAVNEIYKMFGDEDTPGSYDQYVRDMADRYRYNMASEYHDEGTKDAKRAGFVDAMKDYGDYRPAGVDKKIKNYDFVIYNWLPWSISDVLAELDENSVLWADSLTDLSKNVLTDMWPEMADTDTYAPVVIQHEPSLASRLKDYTYSNFGVLSIVLIVILQIMILIPYVWQKDWSLSGPKKYVAKGRGPVVSR